MKWRDAVKLAVAKRMYGRVCEQSGREFDWDGDSCDQDYWIKAANAAIQDVRDGGDDAHCTVVFEMRPEAFGLGKISE